VLKTFKKGGVHPAENKFSAGEPIRELPLPGQVSIPISQHIGAPAKPLVKKGDPVKTGQVIASHEGFVSTNIHATVSGTVKKIDKIIDSSGFRRDAILIDADDNKWVEGVDLSTGIVKEIKLSPGEIIKKVLEAGIVGLGGATFPSHVKLSVPKGKTAEYLILNGVECEPYLTADHRLMLERGEEILIGARIMQKALGAKKILVGIENNKRDAIDHLSELAKEYDDMEVHALHVKYPQGGEKQLVKALINREVPSGGLPIDVGVVAFNVGSVLAAYEAVQKNKPLVQRVVTVTGKDLQHPANYWVRIGTPVSYLIEASGGLPGNVGKVVNGGPMMGKALVSLDTPIVKGSSGIVLFPENESKREEIMPCIRCGKCISVCPMGLEPYLLMDITEKGYYDKLEGRRILDCMECGSCSYICPSNRPLLDYVRLGKAETIKIKKKNKS
jgi:electron transport complex protein RnfC